MDAVCAARAVLLGIAARPAGLPVPAPARSASPVCPNGCGRMASEPCPHEARSTYDAPSGPATHLTCPVCGWEAWVDRLGTPFWRRDERGRTLLRMCRRGQHIEGTQEEDVHPDSHAEVARRVAFLQQVRGTVAAHRGWSGGRKDGHHGVTEGTEER